MADPTKIGQRTQYTQIAGISQVRRLPRLGKIRLGVKATTDAGKEYPKDVSWFVCPPEVQAVYGEQPRELPVMIPVEDPAMFFPYSLKWYSASQLICKGNGEEASRLKDKAGDAHILEVAQPDAMTCKVKCPCGHLKSEDNPKGECSTKATLMVMLPDVSMGGVYAIDSGSHNNIIEINSAIDMIRFLCGRIALIPLKLRRVEREIIRPGEAKRTKKWLLQLVFDQNMSAVQAYRDGAVLALQRSSTLALPEPDRDIRDDKVPIDVTDLEHQEPGPAEGESGSSPPPPATDKAPPIQTGAPPAQRQPGEDDDLPLEDENDGIKAALRGAKTLSELDEVWKEKVMRNSALDGKVKFELQELLLERKKALKGKK